MEYVFFLCNNLTKYIKRKENKLMNLSFLSRERSEKYKNKMNLTDDETKIFDMLTKNYSIIRIADILKMSTRTVDRRIKNIRIKMENIEI